MSPPPPSSPSPSPYLRRCPPPPPPRPPLPPRPRLPPHPLPHPPPTTSPPSSTVYFSGTSACPEPPPPLVRRPPRTSPTASTRSRSSRTTSRTSWRAAPTSRSSSTTPASASAPASAASAGPASGTTSSARVWSSSSSSSPRTTQIATARHRPPSLPSRHSPMSLLLMLCLPRQRAPSVPSARRISHLGRGPSRCPASTFTTPNASYHGWSSTIHALYVALSCLLMTLIMRDVRNQTHSQLLACALELNLGVLLLLLNEGRRAGPVRGRSKGGLTFHCHGLLVDSERKRHSRMGAMGVLVPARKPAAQRMEVHQATKIDHKCAINCRSSSWIWHSKVYNVYVSLRLILQTSKDQRNLQSFYRMEQLFILVLAAC